MRVIRNTVLEAIIVVLVGTAVGFTANAAREKRIKFDRNYFPHSGQTNSRHEEQREFTGPALAAAPPAGRAIESESPTADGDVAEDLEAGAQADHPFQKITLEEVASIFCDPATEQGSNIFLDARNDSLFEEGHIPGAFHCDHYRFEEYVDDVLPACRTAEKIIVYCHGEDCEDSILLCYDLMDADVPYERLYVFSGGWTEWKNNQMPIAKGVR
jgi:rhodanese-related sulfurtransferase